MAKAKVSIKSITPYPSYCYIRFSIKIKAGYKTKDDSLRFYYSTTGSPTKDSDFVTIDFDHDLSDKEVAPGGEVYATYLCFNRTYSDTIYVQFRMQIWSDDESWSSHYCTYKSDMVQIKFKPAGMTQPLFHICEYYNKHDEEGDDGKTYPVWDKRWIDFTDCIELPSYDVNYEDTNEDWEDANYFIHRIKVRSKITGKLDLRFSDLARYNQFLYLIKKSKERNGHGTAYVELMLQVNDDIDEYSSDQAIISEMRCTMGTGLFFIKMDSNPWVAPVFGHYDKYQAISLSINEA